MKKVKSKKQRNERRLGEEREKKRLEEEKYRLIDWIMRLGEMDYETGRSKFYFL